MEEKKKLLTYQKHLQKLASELSRIQELERRRIATDLHDRIGHALASCKIQLTMALKSAKDPQTTQDLKATLNLIDQTIRDTRTLTFEISPPILYEVGLEATLEWLTEQFQNYYSLHIDFIDDRKEKPINEEYRTVLYRAVRELLFNVVKHADADTVKVSLQRINNHFHITVEDNGKGITNSPLSMQSPIPLYSEKGFGLFAISERIQFLGGTFSFETRNPSGVRVTISLPLSTNHDQISVQEIRFKMPKRDFSWSQTTYSTEETSDPVVNKAIILQCIEEVWKQKKYDFVDRFFSADFVFHTPLGLQKGPDSYKKIVSMLHEAFSDFEIAVEDIISDKSKVVLRASYHGIHKGEFLGVPPTGRKVTFTGICIYNLSHGRIIEQWTSADNLGVLQQLTRESSPVDP